VTPPPFWRKGAGTAFPRVDVDAEDIYQAYRMAHAPAVGGIEGSCVPVEWSAGRSQRRYRPVDMDLHPVGDLADADPDIRAYAEWLERSGAKLARQAREHKLGGARWGRFIVRGHKLYERAAEIHAKR